MSTPTPAQPERVKLSDYMLEALAGWPGSHPPGRTVDALVRRQALRRWPDGLLTVTTEGARAVGEWRARLMGQAAEPTPGNPETLLLTPRGGWLAHAVVASEFAANERGASAACGYAPSSPTSSIAARHGWDAPRGSTRPCRICKSIRPEMYGGAPR